MTQYNKILEKMKILLYACFGAGVSYTALNNDINASFEQQSKLDECVQVEAKPENHQFYYPKKMCNIDKSSIKDPKKLSSFISQCTQAKSNWLLINASEATYFDAILH